MKIVLLLILWVVGAMLIGAQDFREAFRSVTKQDLVRAFMICIWTQVFCATVLFIGGR